MPVLAGPENGATLVGMLEEFGRLLLDPTHPAAPLMLVLGILIGAYIAHRWVLPRDDF